ncbi:MAG: LCP family protein [Patescibacteria group bacterium]
MENQPLNFLETTDQKDPQEPQRSPRRSIFFIGLALLIFFAGCIAYGSIKYQMPDDPADYDPVTLAPKKPEGLLKRIGHFVFNRDAVLEGTRDDRINLLLLGMGGIGHDGPFLTDTIIIASIKPSTNQIAMISIPRDLGAKIPGHGWNKINHANAYGEAEKKDWGAAFAAEVVEDTFDIAIQYYVRIDFKAFEEIVDEMNGVAINVERPFTDSLYPAQNEEYQTLTFSAGVQTMDGKRALQYVRSRHGSNDEGSDFARAKRQQKLILALKDKILSFGTLANPVKINNIMKTLNRHITTNMEFPDTIALIKFAKEIDTTNIVRLVLDTSPEGYLQNSFTEDGAFILEPKSGDFKQINSLIKNIFEEKLPSYFDDTPAQTKPVYTTANIEIQNGAWNAGMAMRIKKTLEDNGFQVTKIGNTQERPQAESGIFTISDKNPSDVLAGLQNELRIPIKQAAPYGISAASTTDILIILGENFNE